MKEKFKNSITTVACMLAIIGVMITGTERVHAEEKILSDGIYQVEATYLSMNEKGEVNVSVEINKNGTIYTLYYPEDRTDLLDLNMTEVSVKEGNCIPYHTDFERVPSRTIPTRVNKIAYAEIY